VRGTTPPTGRPAETPRGRTSVRAGQGGWIRCGAAHLPAHLVRAQASDLGLHAPVSTLTGSRPGSGGRHRGLARPWRGVRPGCVGHPNTVMPCPRAPCSRLEDHRSPHPGLDTVVPGSQARPFRGAPGSDERLARPPSTTTSSSSTSRRAGRRARARPHPGLSGVRLAGDPGPDGPVAAKFLGRVCGLVEPIPGRCQRFLPQVVDHWHRCVLCFTPHHDIAAPPGAARAGQYAQRNPRSGPGTRERPTAPKRAARLVGGGRTDEGSGDPAVSPQHWAVPPESEPQPPR
jgi:hypothetical protein